MQLVFTQRPQHSNSSSSQGIGVLRLRINQRVEGRRGERNNHFIHYNKERRVLILSLGSYLVCRIARSDNNSFKLARRGCSVLISDWVVLWSRRARCITIKSMILTKQENTHSKGPTDIPNITREQEAPGREDLQHSLIAPYPQPSPILTDPLVIQVTFLNKVNRVTMDPRATPHAVNVMRMLQLIKATHLIDLEDYDVVDLDAPLVTGRSYYLAFTRYDRPSLVPNRYVGEGVDVVTAWNGHRLFSREGREYQIKKCYDAGIVTELKICRNTPNRLGFTCPFSHCGRLFHKSCDLIVHFHVETGNRPFFCQICGRSFRRKVLLNHHSREGPCRRASTHLDITSNPFALPKNPGYIASTEEHAHNIQSVLQFAQSHYHIHSTAPGSPVISGPSYPAKLPASLETKSSAAEKADPSISFLKQLKLIIALAKHNPVLLTLIQCIQIKRNLKIIPSIQITANPLEICHELMVTALLLNL